MARCCWLYVGWLLVGGVALLRLLYIFLRVMRSSLFVGVLGCDGGRRAMGVNGVCILG